MSKFLNFKILLCIIILIAAFLRFYQLGTNPPSLTWDEAAWGYNAYSLGIDGKDEFGRFLPHDYLESFGDFKPPAYAYLDIIPIKIFGLNEFGTRFPSAFFGTLTVLITFFLTRRIFWKSKNSTTYALLSALFLAISPWHIMLSRAAFEANVATFFLACGVWLFLGSVQSKKWLIVLSAVSFSISIYTFNTSRIVAPLLIILLVFAFFKKLWQMKKETIVALVLGFVMILPIAGFLLSPQAQLRFKEVNIFTDIDVIKRANQQIANDNNAIWSRLIHNRRVLYGVEYVKHYFDNLGPRFLFIKGDGNPKFSTQEVGEMYLWDIPFFIIGILFLIKRKEGAWWLVPLWLLLAIIPAATARETPHALRIETSLPTFQILSAYGFATVILAIKRYRKTVASALLFLLFLNFIYFYHDYFAHYPKQFSGEWQYGYKQSISYVSTVQDKFNKIQITNSLGRPYIYYLFYTRTDPSLFRKTAKIERDAFGFVSVVGFSKYEFPKRFDYSKKDKKTLFIGTPFDSPSINVLGRFYLLNKDLALVAYTYD
ncbi:MAG: hypothetical protein A2152_03395 [Candidatus Levybacteria bacterium RBG_16_35_6]|nr:MAG: hypothetical protein A2152_03395 [Candidatus Levybacteria bacterium RBG_16_35_6]